MKQILITGVHSYIGNAVEQYLREYNQENGRELYRVDKLSLREYASESLPVPKCSQGTECSQASKALEALASFRSATGVSYDALLHVAGLAHADTGRVSEEEKARYYRINRDLAVWTAKRAREAGICQFIYLSSVIIYGSSGSRKHITASTAPAPANFYGDSKLQAELALKELETEQFQVAILRLPMVYGRGCKGNFPLLVKLARKLPVFPAVKNSRSMIYAENLAEFIRLLIEKGAGGLYLPQNREYVSTGALVKAIGEAKGRHIRLSSVLNPFVWLALKLPGRPGQLAGKAFGSLTADHSLEGEIQNYQRYSFEESLKRSLEQ